MNILPKKISTKGPSVHRYLLLIVDLWNFNERTYLCIKSLTEIYLDNTKRI